ncbi:MAG: DUF3530 family protein [Gammaproteobacteria bacterium]|nr:DUF3530 family protein [Gammaproteobacteria bacterium]
MHRCRLRVALCGAGFVCLAGWCTAALHSAPADYEETVSAKLAETHQDEVLRLRAGAREFTALFKPATTANQGRAVLILHGMSGHADWPDVVAPLRNSLPAQGWATLSIQLPVLPPSAPWADYDTTLRRVPARIDSALACLSRLRYGKLAVIGYGYGAMAAAQFLAARGKGFSAFVGISMLAPPFLMPRPDLLDSLRHISVPVLDIYGSRDHADILREVDDRRRAGTQDRTRSYEQFAIEGADHDYAGYEPMLISRIAGWLERSVPGIEPQDAPAAAVTGTPAESGNGGDDTCRPQTN